MTASSGAQVLVLSGGGVLGAAQAGMLEALEATGWRPDVIVGVSAGALNGTAVAADFSATAVVELQRMWKSQPTRGPFPTRTAGQLWRVARSGSLQDDEPLRELLASSCPVADLQETAIPIHVAAIELVTGEARWFSSGPALEILYASAAIPGILPPALIDGTYYIDGATVANVPVSYALTFNPSRIVVLDVSVDASKRETPTTPLAIVLRSLAHARAAVTDYEFATLGEHIDVHHVHYSGPPGLRLQDFGRTRELIDAGRTAMSAHLEHRPLHPAPGANQPEPVTLAPSAGRWHLPRLFAGQKSQVTALS